MNTRIAKATHQGIIKISDDIEIPAYNLDSGERVLSRIGFLKAIGRKGKAKGGRRYDEEFKTPVFLSAKNIKPFITNELLENSTPIPFIDMSGNESIGYKAELLPSVCYVFIDAFEKGVLLKTQVHIYEKAKLLVRGFAKIGIIALVDEATGYQYDRERYELQLIFKTFISDEILEWQQAFHLSFYKEIFRLWNIPFTAQNIRRKPQFIGHLTNKFVYENLPKGIFILEKLKQKTPKTITGNYKYRLHQSLTPEVGRESLKKVIYSIEALASVSNNKRQFIRLIEEKYGQKEIPFQEFERLDIPNHPVEFPLSDFNQKLKKALDFNPKD